MKKTEGRKSRETVPLKTFGKLKIPIKSVCGAEAARYPIDLVEPKLWCDGPTAPTATALHGGSSSGSNHFVEHLRTRMKHDINRLISLSTIY
jgi:hypothetical protein